MTPAIVRVLPSSVHDAHHSIAARLTDDRLVEPADHPFLGTEVGVQIVPRADRALVCLPEGERTVLACRRVERSDNIAVTAWPSVLPGAAPASGGRTSVHTKSSFVQFRGPPSVWCRLHETRAVHSDDGILSGLAAAIAERTQRQLRR